MWDNISDFFKGIPEFFINFWDSLTEFLSKIFKPKEDSFTNIKNIVESKFDFIDTIKIAANSMKDLISNIGAAPKLTINVNSNKYGVKELTIIDLEWYKPYKTYGDLILTGFIYAFFLWRLFITVPNILYGVGGAVHDSYKITEIKGGKD